MRVISFPLSEKSIRVVLQGRGFVAFLATCLLLGASGCGSVLEGFVGNRVKDPCGGTWPVCTTRVGCFVGDQSYVEGRFPGTNQVAIKIFEPSTVKVTFYFLEMSGSGEETAITFNEDSCKGQIRRSITGKVLLDEQEKTGIVEREAELSGIGDHLIRWDSDARARYYAKVDITPIRFKDPSEE